MATTLSSSLSASSLSGRRQNNSLLRAPRSLTFRTTTRKSSSSFSVKAFSAPVLTQDDLKKLAADKAVDYVQSGMVLGLGTGSTAAFVVAKLGALLQSGELKDIVGIPTSKRTEEQARSLGIPLSVLDDHPKLDLAIDGADEVDPDLNLVKGRGGALLREKMVEAASDKFVVVVDDTKLVDGLGGSGLAMPVEVVQFCWKYNLLRLQELFQEEGCDARLRLNESGKPYITDNYNYIVDLYFKTPIKDSLAAGKEISAFEGVVEHGLFLNMATSVIIAGKTGVETKTKTPISFTLTSKSGGEDVDDEFADLYIVKWSSLMIPPITIIMVNLIAIAVGFSRTIYSVIPQWSLLIGGVLFSFWVLAHLYPFAKGLIGRRGRTPTIVYVWSGLIAITISLLWVAINPPAGSTQIGGSFQFS